MIDTQTERMVTLVEATQILPGRPNLSTIWRWRLRGVRGVTLETILIGGKRFTSLEALTRFQHAVTAVADGKSGGAAETPRRRERAIERAERKAKELGV